MAQVLLELQVAPGQYQHMLVDESLVDEWAESGWATPGNSVPQPASQSFSDTAVAALMTVATATRAAIDARVHAVADATYVRSVNGVPVDPQTGNVQVSGGGSASFTEDPTRPGIYLMEA